MQPKIVSLGSALLLCVLGIPSVRAQAIIEWPSSSHAALTSSGLADPLSAPLEASQSDETRLATTRRNENGTGVASSTAAPSTPCASSLAPRPTPAQRLVRHSFSDGGSLGEAGTFDFRPAASQTIALSGGAFEKKPVTDPAIFPVSPAAGPPTIWRLVDETAEFLFRPEAPRIVVNTSLPPLPRMDYPVLKTSVLP